MIGEFFDRRAEIHVEEHFRPHWSQAGAIVFLTFRTYDSIPRDVLQGWERAKQEWMSRRGHQGHWSTVLATLAPQEQNKFKKEFNRQREAFLDTCCGRCVLRDPSLAEIVAKSLLHFDNERYQMGDFVVMPNHVHLLASFPTADAMKQQCDSWLHYTAREINRQLGDSGKFWQQEPFDHLVRSLDQYEYLRRYIADNPAKARVAPGEYYYRQLPP